MKIPIHLYTIQAVIVLSAFACNSGHPGKPEALFTLVDETHSHISFANNLSYTETFNTYTYRNFYNGAGVGIGDVNNDGLPDLYFCGNQAGNKLYLNKGNFEFEDITGRAGVACQGSWSTGVSMADVNGDGLLDLYVCKSGDPNTPHRKNELFINNGDLTFTEKGAEYGLDAMGLSNHASFFDYDRDGDLDCYLLSNSFQSVTEFDIKPGQREIRDSLGANKLLRNDGAHFTDVSREAGIYGSKIGFGLGVSVGDLNRDGWPDIYVSNDFFERDYLYLNNKNGTFSECLTGEMTETSLGAMGADVADINNDTWPEIFTTEMTPEGNARQKTKVLFEDWQRYRQKLANGYSPQFSRNVLQLNNQNGTFSEIGRYSGVATTDWSWGALIMDLDNDGWKDIFVANGIYKDLLDRDYLDIYSNPSMMRSMIKTEESAILKIIDMIPSVPVPNYAFRNNGNLTFTNQAAAWGLASPSFSNGAAYGDLDNDGDLDLVVNNVNMPCFVYRNETQQDTSLHALTVQLKGTGMNTAAIGASATIYYAGKIGYQEVVPMRGFMSCSDSRLHFGTGNCTMADSLLVRWPDGTCTTLRRVPVNQLLTVSQDAAAACSPATPVQPAPLFQSATPPRGFDFLHRENDFNDFERDGLLFQMMSNEGPRMAVGDVNGDGREDLYICGAKDSPGALFVQDAGGGFHRTNQALFEKDKLSEDTDCVFFDADGDGDTDLYVTSGGTEFSTSSAALADRLYLNNGRGQFTRSDQLLPVPRYESSSCVDAADYDGDGDIDLFVGIRLIPFSYGVPVNGYLLENDGKGHFSNVAPQKAPMLKEIGMITDMTWADADGDGDPDMVIVGDWMPVKVLVNNNGSFIDVSEEAGLGQTDGWWHTVCAKDLNQDGNMDFILGNHGLNSFFKALPEKPVMMTVNDFDLNGTVEQLITTFNGDTAYPVAMKDDLVKQIPMLASKYKKFADYSHQTPETMFPADVLNRSIRLYARTMESCILMNTGKGSFRIQPLPPEAQFAPVYAIWADDFDKDGQCDILLGGNQPLAKPQTGIYAASYGLFLKGMGQDRWQAVPAVRSGILTRGAVRDIKLLKIGNRSLLTIARSNENHHFYTY